MGKGKRGEGNNNGKKIIIAIIVIILIAGIIFGVTKLVKKSDTQNEQETQNPNISQGRDITGNTYEVKGKTLIAYFSRTGNTSTIASLINRKIGGDIFKIQPKELYSYNYDEALERMKKEKDQNARPEIQNKVENMDEYDVIFLGYPVWLDTIPMIINTFLETYNLEGKTIVPFCTDSEAGAHNSVEDIQKAEPKAKVLSAYAIRGSNVGEESTKESVDLWIESTQKQLEE